MPYGGIATFARAPHQPLEADWSADVGVLGLPFDIALGFRPGARFAPRALRDASLRYALPPEGFYDLEGDRVRLAGLRLVDAGDVVLPSLEPELARERITEAARALRARARLPLFLGGDHSVTYPILRAYADLADLHVVQIDAHLDFTDVRNDTRYSNSSPFRRASEELPGLSVTTLGLRGLRFDREAVQAALARGHTLISARDLEADLEAALARLPRGRPVYLSFDVDALDPALLPATSSPEVDGLSYRSALRIVAETVRRNTLVGLDLVEFAPNLDASGNSGLLLARLLMETLCEVFE
nr:arginase family protein [Deinobacterium chartae]